MRWLNRKAMGAKTYVLGDALLPEILQCAARLLRIVVLLESRRLTNLQNRPTI